MEQVEIFGDDLVSIPMILLTHFENKEESQY